MPGSIRRRNKFGMSIEPTKITRTAIAVPRRNSFKVNINLIEFSIFTFIIFLYVLSFVGVFYLFVDWFGYRDWIISLIFFLMPIGALALPTAILIAVLRPRTSRWPRILILPKWLHNQYQHLGYVPLSLSSLLREQSVNAKTENGLLESDSSGLSLTISIKPENIESRRSPEALRQSISKLNPIISDTSSSTSTPPHLVCVPTGNMLTARYHHSATLLPTDHVLIVGGMYSDDIENHILSSAELYDPTVGAFTRIRSLHTARYWHQATLLKTGEVLISGGVGSDGQSLASIELYDPAAKGFTFVGNMTVPRHGHTVVRLLDGRLLISGGSNANANRLDSAEIYDPITRTFNATGNMRETRLDENNKNATLLEDGRVLITGGYGATGKLDSAELYDPIKGTFDYTGYMLTSRTDHVTTPLANGQVLITGGVRDVGSGSVYLTSCEIYDPKTGTFISITSMSKPHFLHAAIHLLNDWVLIAGGFDPIVEVYDPVTRTFPFIGNMTVARWLAAAVLLPTGQVLVTGGNNHTSTAQGLASAELITIMLPS